MTVIKIGNAFFHTIDEAYKFLNTFGNIEGTCETQIVDKDIDVANKLCARTKHRYLMPSQIVNIWNHEEKSYEDAIILCRYGLPAKYLPVSETVLGPYPDLIDVWFIKSGKLSNAHFFPSFSN